MLTFKIVLYLVNLFQDEKKLKKALITYLGPDKGMFPLCGYSHMGGNNTRRPATGLIFSRGYTNSVSPPWATVFKYKRAARNLSAVFFTEASTCIL